MAESALEKGDYTTAIVKALEALEKEPDMVEAEAVLKDAWQRANSEWSGQIATIETATTAQELIKALSIYQKQIEIHKIVETAQRKDLNPDSAGIFEKGLKTQYKVATLYFEEGNVFFKQGGRENARKAAQYFTQAKKMNPDVPDIDTFIEQATEQATVKVIVVNGPERNKKDNAMDMIPVIEQKLSALDFVEVITPDERLTAQIGDSTDAQNAALRNGADILVHFEPITSVKTDLKKENRPINSNVTAAPNMTIYEMSLVASGGSEVSYRVIDLKTEKVLDEGSLTVRDSTDYGFSYSRFSSVGLPQKIKIGDMAKEETLQVYRISEYDYSLFNQLKTYEKIDMGYQNGLKMANVSIDFSRVTSPEQLKNTQLNGHTFALFDVVGFELDSDNPDVMLYAPIYSNELGDGFSAAVKVARQEKELYEALNEWATELTSVSHTKRASETPFLDNFYKTKVPTEFVAKISSVIK